MPSYFTTICTLYKLYKIDWHRYLLLEKKKKVSLSVRIGTAWALTPFLYKTCLTIPSFMNHDKMIMEIEIVPIMADLGPVFRISTESDYAQSNGSDNFVEFVFINDSVIDTLHKGRDATVSFI